MELGVDLSLNLNVLAIFAVARDGGDIINEVKKLHPDIDWQLQYIMPQPVTQVDHERFVASIQAWNKEGCVRLGGPQFTDMPSATP